MFFQRLKRKLRTRNLLFGLLFLVMSALFAAVAISNGFSSEASWKLGPRHSDVGIPVANWVVSCVMLVLCALLLGACISSVKEAFAQKTYKKVLDTVRQIGDPATVEQMLERQPKNKLAKGELRLNASLFFYLTGGEVFLLPTKTIDFVQPVTKQNKSSNIYYVQVGNQEQKILVETKKKNQLLLAQCIFQAVHGCNTAQR